MYELLRINYSNGDTFYSIEECLPYLGPIEDKVKSLILSGVPAGRLCIVKQLKMSVDVSLKIEDLEGGNNNESK